MRQKQANSVGSATPDPMVDVASAEAVPKVEISNKPPPGQTGPKGLQPRQTYSRVNTGAPPMPDAGVSGQKSMAPRGLEFLPKLSEVMMSTTVTPTPTINDMLKAAMSGTLGKIDVTAEAARQLGEEPEKTAASVNTDSLPTDLLMKLADAVDFVADQIEKGAEIHLPSAAGGQPAPGTGPGALKVMKAETSGKNPSQPGHSGGHPTGGGGMETGKHGPAPANAMATNEKMQHPKQPADPVNGKTAEALEASNVERLSKVGSGFSPAIQEIRETAAAIKAAEDANNPAQISAGPAVPPDASPSEEKVPSMPADVSAQERLISSNRAAIDYTKKDAKRDPISDVGKLVTETPMKDPVLNQLFDHSGQAGVKTSQQLDVVKVAAARALLSKLASEASDKTKKKESNMSSGQAGAPPPPGVPSPAFTQ